VSADSGKTRSFILCEKKHEWICSKASISLKNPLLVWEWTLVQFTYDERSRWNNQQRQARFDWKDDWSQEWILEFWGPKQTLRKGPKTLIKYVVFHVYNKWSKKWARGPYNCWCHIKTGAPIPWSCNTETLFAERKLNLLIFFCEFASAWKPVSHCKLFDVIWFSLFFVYALHVEGSLAHLSWQTYELHQSLLNVAVELLFCNQLFMYRNVATEMSPDRKTCNSTQIVS